MSQRTDAWRDWIVKRQRGEHDHTALRADGSRAACPVPTCTAKLEPTEVDQQRTARRRKR